jgi:hypothetical protein
VKSGEQIRRFGSDTHTSMDWLTFPTSAPDLGFGALITGQAKENKGKRVQVR